MKTIGEFQAAYAGGREVVEVLREVWEAIRDVDDDGIFISKMSWEAVLAQLEGVDKSAPLYGVPYVAKDNIDVAGLPTTAACPEFSYDPEESATVVELLRGAGAVCFGKTNLDQFATGLVGVRTPYPVPKNPFDENYLPGGSSCGSAVAVSRGLVPFSLGTDTAGSGRVPAAFNELVGLKATRGYLSTKGLVDACKSLDCISVFANSCGDADLVYQVTAKQDREEAWSREVVPFSKRIGGEFRFGVPRAEDLKFFGWEEAGDLFRGAVERFEELGGTPVEVSLEPFMAAARLLYEGPWVTERFVAIKDFLKEKPESVFPVTRGIIEGGEAPLASSLFEAQYKMADCKRLADQAMEGLAFVITPTTPRNYTVDEVAAEPVKLNSILGTYTNFMNLLDYCAVALPAGRYDGRLPWGVTIFAQAGMDRGLLEIGARYEGLNGRDAGGDFTGAFDEVQVAVCGAHLDGMALNWQLRDRGASLDFVCRTADCYRMYLVPEGGGLPERPALIRVGDGEGVGIEVEVWSMTRAAFGDFVSKIPGPLGIGKVLLKNGNEVSGFIAEPRAAIRARDLSEFRGWRGYLDSKEG
ncbi:allophanate hydrolase [Luteolibacter sp. AS25]|uniref:allophanate hydrolase n=1 Tax=Luteolibacter sp. AS25 TaxID=3135776 RepID=UPI00398AC329